MKKQVYAAREQLMMQSPAGLEESFNLNHQNNNFNIGNAVEWFKPLASSPELLSNQSSPPTDHQSPTLNHHSSSSTKEEMAMNLLDNWRQQNEAIRQQLLAVKKEIENADCNTPFLPANTPIIKVPDAVIPVNVDLKRLSKEETRKKLEEENKSLMQIVAQVKEDLQKAAMTSPFIAPNYI